MISACKKMFLSMLLATSLVTNLNGCDDGGNREPAPPDQGGPALDATFLRPDTQGPTEDATPRDGTAPSPDTALDMSIAPRGHTVFAFPIHPDDREHIHAGLIIGVDHDPTSTSRILCENYEGRGFPGCYDEHEGTDFMVWGGFETTDAQDIRVVAAAAGTITRIEDGHYDRCSGDLNTLDVDCNGHEMVANRVHIRHADGLQSRYLHLKKDSVLVSVGMTVQCGDLLGMVGSSGRSIAPHLHFELRDASGALLDPYSPDDNEMNSYWSRQRVADGLPAPICSP